MVLKLLYTKIEVIGIPSIVDRYYQNGNTYSRLSDGIPMVPLQILESKKAWKRDLDWL
jgi:hypothetical protein